MSDAAAATSTVDLHTHSTASDGMNTPAELVEMASRRGLRFLALTDHDSTDGLDAALAAGERFGVTVIPGVELGTDVAAGELHVLGYFIDHRDEQFQETLRAFRASRQVRVRRIVAQLAQAGVEVDLAEVQALAPEGAIGRAHVARVLVRHGYANSLDDAFARYLLRGRPGYVARPRLSPVEAVALVRSAGGAAVLAHPLSVADLDGALAELVAAGLAGLEVFYAAYSDDERARLLRLAERHGLIPTGGSDFHGPGEREGRDLGSVAVPEDTVARLRDAAGAR